MPHIPLRSDLFGITALLDYRRDTAEPLCQLTHALLRGESTLTEAEREMIATVVSARNECAFCSSAHAAATCILSEHAAESGASLVETALSIPVSPKMRTLLDIAACVQERGDRVTAAHVTRAREAGATDREIHDTVLIAALFSLYNRYVDGLAAATPNDPAFYTALGARISTRGYIMPPESYQPLAVPQPELPDHLGC
jgi:uncharacterized peroxidase-related enzyme